MTTRSDYYVYALFRENGVPFYIGKGRGDRWNKHERDARQGVQNWRSQIIRRMQARGIKMPKIKIHDNLTEVLAHRYEVTLIKAIGRYPHGPLVNATAGGEGNSDPSPETRHKMSVAHRNQKPSPEHHAKMLAALRARDQKAVEAHRAKINAIMRTPEHRAKLSVAHTGQTISPEHREKLAAALRGRKRPPDVIAKMSAAASGKKQSAETIAKRVAASFSSRHRANLSAAARGRKVSAETRAKISAAQRGRKASLEARQNMSAAARHRTKTLPVIGRKLGLRAATRLQISSLRPESA